MQPEFVLKPNVKKVTLLNVSKVAFAVILVLGIVFYLSMLIDLSIFKEAFGFSENEMPTLSQVITNFILAVVVASIITVIISYMSIGKRQYVFFPDRMEKYTNFLIFNVGKEIIPYNNIASIRVDMSFSDHLIKSGTIILELTGMKKKSVALEYIDNAEGYLPYIQKLLNENKMRQTTGYQFNQKIEETLDRM